MYIVVLALRVCGPMKQFVIASIAKFVIASMYWY